MNQYLRSHFYKELKVSMMKTGIRVPEIAISYASDLLARDPFVLPDALFDVVSAAMAEPNRALRLSMYKDVGDFGLLLSGVFRPYMARKGLSVDYCTNIAVFGYRNAGGMSLDDTIYRSLEDNVGSLSNIINAAFWP